MTVEKLDRKDIRLLAACAVIAAVSFFIGVRYFFRAFPEASIEFRTTKESSRPIAEAFAAKAGLETAEYRHAAVFGYDDDAKTFLEREVGVEESGRLLDSTIRLWRWRHRWFRPLQKEEIQVEVTTKGEPVGFEHLLAEEAEGASLPEAEARGIAEAFLERTMERPLDTLAFVEAAQQKRPHRVDHTFTWKVKGSAVKGADYRIRVGVGGDRVSAYQEFLHVPQEWQDSYEELRSRNTTAGAVDTVLLLLTFVAMLVLLVLRIRKGDVRFRTAGALGLITFALMTVSRLNQLPVEFYDYDTTTSYPGFLLLQVINAFAAGFGLGAVIFLLAASAEPVYRDRFPKALSLASLLRLRALRTKEVFIATAVGLTLTCFFFAYENVFYIIANSLGAWAPREVNYSDLLSTVFPWVYVLFFGWFPAISEEFISRMFSIPFFEKILRTRAGAIVIAAVIWAFGHAAYPNQPFWIRGLEVGLAGVVFGLVFLRFGIAAVVITHFSVDALYTAFVMIRSESLYYQLTGSLSAGIFGVLFLGMLIAYVRRGGFAAPEVTNEQENALILPEPIEGIAPSAESAAGGEGLSVEGAGAPARPMSGARIALGLAIAAGLAALSLVPIASFGDWVDFGVTKSRAIESAETFLRGAGFDVASYRSVATAWDRTDPSAAAYLVEAGGLAAARATYETRVPTPIWRARFFIPGEKEEYRASVDPRTGEVLGFSRELPEDAAGASLPPEEALRIAETFVRARGQDPSAQELKEQTAKDEKARRDHTFVWEQHHPDMAEAAVRYEVVVQGDRVGSWTRSVKIPEEWRLRRERTTAAKVILRFLKVPVLGLIAGFAIFAFIVKIRRGEIPWKFAALVGGVLTAAVIVKTILGLDRAWADPNVYETSYPLALWRVLMAVSVIVSGIAAYIGGGLIASIAGALVPAATRMLGWTRRRELARDALIAGVIALGFRLGLPSLATLATRMIPSGLLVSSISIPPSFDSRIPFLSALMDTLQGAITLPGIGAIVLGIAAIHFRSALSRVVMAALFVLSFLPTQAARPSEALAGAIALTITIGGMFLLAIVFLRNNPLAWVWSAWFAIGIDLALHLIEQSSSALRQNGIVVLILVLLPGIVLLRDAFAGPRPSPAQS